MAQRAPELFSDNDDTEDFFRSGGQQEPREEERAPQQEHDPIGDVDRQRQRSREDEQESEREKPEQEAEAEAEAEDEAKPEAEAEAEDKKETLEEEAERRQVPLAALREERQKRKEIQEELRESRRQQQRMEQAWQQIQQRLAQQQDPTQQAPQQAPQQGQQAPQQQAPQQQAQNQPPDYDEDPAGYLRWQQEQLDQKLREIDEWRQQNIQAYQQDAQTQRFAAQVTDFENRFRQRQPDYDEAVNFLKTRRDQELYNWGVTDPQQRQQIVNQEVMFLANSAMQNGDSPAERAYQMAREWGWLSPQELEAQTQQNQQAKSTQQRQQKVEQNTKKVQLAQKGSQASKSLSNSKGEPPPNLSLENLADIDDPKEFDKQWEKMFGKSPIV